jgi:hypothetical protein
MLHTWSEAIWQAKVDHRNIQPDKNFSRWKLMLEKIDQEKNKNKNKVAHTLLSLKLLKHHCNWENLFGFPFGCQ